MISPAEVLSKLQENASKKTQDTLNSIYEICIEQKERGLEDFSIATIAKLGHKRGVPQAQSIRNKSGEPYRALLKAFSDAAPKKVKLEIPKKDEDWIDEIENPKHKLLTRIMASKLKTANQKLREILPPNLRIDVYDHKSQPEPHCKLNELERRALEYLTSENFQKKWKIKPTEYGEYEDERGEIIFKAGTLSAIKKALENM
jgi:hypothetical protein